MVDITKFDRAEAYLFGELLIILWDEHFHDYEILQEKKKNSYEKANLMKSHTDSVRLRVVCMDNMKQAI